jgi:hypothetical protein
MERFKHIDNYKLADAKLFGDRFSAIDFVVPNTPRYLEVGAGNGHYSQHIVEMKSPKLMHILDWYGSGSPSGEYTAETHKEFIENKFKDQNLTTIVGDSKYVMQSLIGNEYDYIYLDASHDYDGVTHEINVAAQICAPGGVIGINDYTYYSPFDGEKYHVIEAVNNFLYENPEWRVLAFQLGHLGYADIYITRL